jgi:hypothetical protein
MDFENDNHSFTFRFHSAEGERDLEMNCNALYLGDILDRFRDFLQGCGYQIDGMIDVVSFEKEESPVTLGEQSKFDFSNIPNNNWMFSGTMNDTIPPLTTNDISSLTTQMPLSASPSGMASSWSAELPSSTGSKIKVNF